MDRTELRKTLRVIVTHPRVTASDALFVSRMTNLHQAGLSSTQEDETRLKEVVEKYTKGE